MIKDVSLKTIVAFLLPFIVIYGLYIQFHGDYSPGGGFQAGMIVATAVILYAMVFGNDLVLKILPLSTIESAAALGVLLYGGTGFLTIILGGNFLSYNFLAQNAVSGQVIGIFMVECGVGLAVACSMMVIYFYFTELDR